MSVPGRVDAAAILLSLDPPDWFLRHSRAVAEIAAWLAARAEARGSAVDRRLVDSAALLHDVDKLLPGMTSRPHGEGSAAWLSERGFEKLGPVVAAHPVVRLADDDWYREWTASASTEARIVAYADKRAGQRLEPMAERFASWRRRYPPERRSDAWSDETIETIRRRAEALETEVCSLAGVAPDEIARLRWTGDALLRARRSRGENAAAQVVR